MASGEAEAKPATEDEHHDQKHKPKLEGAVFPASKHAQHHHHPVDIDADTPVDAVRAPGCFNRIKEEVEAIVETIAEKLHLKKPPS